MASLQCEACHGAVPTMRIESWPARASDHRRLRPQRPIRRLPSRTPPAPAAMIGMWGSPGTAACTSATIRPALPATACTRAGSGQPADRRRRRSASIATGSQRADSMKPSSHPIRFDAMVCTDCHDPHGSVADALLVRNTTNELCVSCHAEYRGPMLFDHAPVSEDCTLCHEPHGSACTRRCSIAPRRCSASPATRSGAIRACHSPSRACPAAIPSAMVLGQKLRELPHPGARVESPVRLQPDALDHASAYVQPHRYSSC